ncbi:MULTISPECIES: hypothetical protein [Paraburkholderia]|uniref:Uncharacterized protein n=1 Tax=Paraburkholderia podalyriae TaxID=1938811 RepID=A0ABR7PU14_9BURK|nr:hypothetical protein [Paraburkholderia podalyriae]MBC8749774.1 hypothetical protein [Paraburkholderia podalyriae]
MNVIRIGLAELVGMFVDDGMLAFFTVLLIGAVTILVKFAGVSGVVGGALLFIGTIVVLAESVMRASRR